MADLGQYDLTGRGGVTRGLAEASRLFRVSTLLGNPWGQYNLAGVPVDRDRALDLYRGAAAREWGGTRDAAAAVARLESSAH